LSTGSKRPGGITAAWSPCAIAALAAEKQGKFWEIHEKLFANQKDLNDAKVEAIAQEIGLNMEQFNKDLKTRPLHL
jgi:predicted DsbA family dithiol-disulfide isomerase